MKRKRRRLDGEDRISGLPDDVLGDIVSLLPTKDGARTQILSSRWRPLWRSAPVNIDLRGPAASSVTSRVLSAHPGPGRRFSLRNIDATATALDGWLRSPALDGLQELDFHLSEKSRRPCIWHLRNGVYFCEPPPPPLPLPASVHRFSSTLSVASFGTCVFPDDARAPHLPLLKQLTLSYCTISESSLHALLAGCPVLESLLLLNSKGFSRVKIVSPSLRSIGVSNKLGRGYDVWLQQLVIDDAPCLERLLFFSVEEIWVISAPRLFTLGTLHGTHKLRFGTTAVQGSTFASLAVVVPSVKVLALCASGPCLDVAINLIKCFPHVERLYIDARGACTCTACVGGEEDASYDKYLKLVGTLDVRLRKIVLKYYVDDEFESHVNFAKFLLMNARVLESMRLESLDRYVDDIAWIARQRRLLQIEKRASRGARFDFARVVTTCVHPNEQIHDLSILDPFPLTPTRDI